MPAVPSMPSPGPEPARPEPAPRRPGRGRRAFALVLLAVASVVAMAAVESGGREALARSALATGAAAWIWLELPPQSAHGTAFQAVRDVDLGAQPPERARLLVAADPEHLVWVNGTFVGSGRYRPGGVLAAYEVGELLVPGDNRIVALLRSERGHGGFLAALVPTNAAGETGPPLVATDGAWQIVRSARDGLLEGWLPLARSGSAAAVEGFPGAVTEAPRVWGLPPAGRWGWPEAPDEAVAPAGAPGPPRISLPVVPGPRGPFGTVASGEPLRIDLGETVEGVLALRFAPADGPGEPPPAALVAVGTGPLPVGSRLATGGAAATLALALPLAHRWRDAVVRRVRWVEIYGTRPVVGVEVLPADGPAIERAGPVVEEDGARRPGLFGIPTWPLRPPIEKELRRELQGVAGGAGR